jgi:hypothetical protein
MHKRGLKLDINTKLTRPFLSNRRVEKKKLRCWWHYETGFELSVNFLLRCSSIISIGQTVLMNSLMQTAKCTSAKPTESADLSFA